MDHKTTGKGKHAFEKVKTMSLSDIIPSILHHFLGSFSIWWPALSLYNENLITYTLWPCLGPPFKTHPSFLCIEWEAMDRHETLRSPLHSLLSPLQRWTLNPSFHLFSAQATIPHFTSPLRSFFWPHIALFLSVIFKAPISSAFI